jgi:hypothetical protein
MRLLKVVARAKSRYPLKQLGCAMSLGQWIGLGGLAVIGAVIAFAFRQGFKVKPLDPSEAPPDRSADVNQPH